MGKKSIVLISNLYPNSNEKTRGLFIKQLTDSIAIKTRISVIAPIPFNPLELFRRKDSIPSVEIIDGIEVFHPRYIVIPKILRSLTGYFFYLGIRSTIEQLVAQNRADVISAHWVYPDGFGAGLAAKKFNLPIALHALGCDINEYTKYRIRRQLITKALIDSDINIVKSHELKNKIEALGIPLGKTKVIHNGVNQDKFIRQPMDLARKKLKLEKNKKLCLFVGNFQVEKGLNYLIDAFALLKHEEVELLVIGSGPLEFEIKKQIMDNELENKITLIGRVEHQFIPDYLAAVNLLCLPSLREGCPNVVLEALSCGTPVVASNVGAVPDIISKPEFGLVVSPENPDALAEGISKSLNIDKNDMPVFDWYDWDKNAEMVVQQLYSL
ncbi:MAG: glycosyltransferase [Kangiellaceae bacterium]|nr:glycosyltransferase [Kangiellaceae bacterium]